MKLSAQSRDDYVLMDWDHQHEAERFISYWNGTILKKKKGSMCYWNKIICTKRDNYVEMDRDDQSEAERIMS